LKVITKSFLRYPVRRLSLSLLQLMGIGFGVAAVVGMTLSARTALTSFTRAVEFLQGKASHSIQRPAGPMEEALLPKLAADPAVEWFSPVIDRRLRLRNGELVRLLGVDPFLDRSIRPEIAGDQLPGSGENGLSFLEDEKSVFIDRNLLVKEGLTPGGTVGTNKGDFYIRGTFPNPSGEPLILMDIGHAQRYFHLEGYVDRVDLVLSNEVDFRSRWSKGFLIQSAQQKRETFSAMLQAFRLNLEALSLLALFVGVFLIYNTAMFAVVSRRRDAGILRSLGASRLDILVAFLTEILILGLIGGALGGGIGYWLTRFLIGLIGSSISNLYFYLRPEPVIWSGWILWTGVFLGGGASLLGAVIPLVELIRSDPVMALRGRVASRESGRKARQAALAGLLILAASLILFLLPGTHIYVGFAGVFGFCLGVSLLTGIVILSFDPFVKRFLNGLGRLTGKIAAGNIRQNLGRTSVAVAAFMVALSMSIGLGIMIGSFRESLIWWMGSQLRGDLYIGRIGEAEVPEDFYNELRKMGDIGGVHPYRNVQIFYGKATVNLSAIDASVLQRYARFGWLKGGDENWEMVKRGGVVISESFSRRFGVRPGDVLVLEGLRGPAEFKVGAVFYDYTTEHGLIMMDRSTFVDTFGDHTINDIGVFIDPGHPHRAEILENVRKKAEARGLPVLTGSQLRANVLEVFDTTFAVTRSMRAITILVAFFGIAGALLTLFLERRREFGVYRALGFSTGQVARMTLLESLGMGALSFFLSVVVGTLLAVLLIKVINLRSFNWTIFFYPALQPYLLTAITASLASLGAAAYPIWKVCRTYPQMQIREE
jgi:putative ABC transport system permease protein